eukprot:4706978-Amphidinium_carterae.1
MANTCRVLESTAATNVMGWSVSRGPFRNPKSRATRGSSSPSRSIERCCGPVPRDCTHTAHQLRKVAWPEHSC